MLGLFFFVSSLLLSLALATQLVKNLLKEEPKNLPHGNMGWPLFGETIGFLKPHRSNTPGTFLEEHCSRYGKVFKSHLFGSPAIVSCDHELNMYILQNEDKLFQASYPKTLHGILGKFSLLLVTGDLRKKIRNIVTSFIRAAKVTPSYIHFAEEMTISMIESWRKCKEISFYKEAKKFTLSLVVKNLLNIEPEDEIASKILEDFETYMKGFISLPLYIPGTAYAKAVQARSGLSSTIKEIIEKREKGNFGPPKGDFLDVILSKECLSDEEKVSVVLDILLGGYETTATLMALVIYFLADTPNAYERIREEHLEIRRNKDHGKPLDLEDYKKMDFTNNVISEALRCGNVVKFVHRKALQDVKFQDHVIPSGWKVLPIFTAVHFDSNLHENPLEFNPWRWDDKAAMSKKVSPFGGGPRLCPGAELAKVETAFFLHHFVLNYRWKTKADDFPIAYPYVEFRRGLLLEIEPAADME